MKWYYWAYKTENSRTTLLELNEAERLYFLDLLLVGVSKTLSVMHLSVAYREEPSKENVINEVSQILKSKVTFVQKSFSSFRRYSKIYLSSFFFQGLTAETIYNE